MPHPWSVLGGGGPVTNVTGVAPITSSGGPTPAVGITPATDLAAGSLSAADKTKLDNLSGCESHLVKDVGQYACAENDSTIATGYASKAEGKGTRTGLALQTFTIPANGTLVTIAGDVRSQFELGQPSVRITPVTPAAGATVSRLVASAPAFAAGNTTFNLNAAIDATTTGGTIVQSDSAAPDNAFGTIPAGGTLVTIVGDVTASFFNNQSIRIWPFSPVELADVIRTIVSVPVFAAGNTTFTLNTAIDPTTTGAIFYASQARGQGAHAEGVGGVSDGYASHKEGLAIASSNDGSHAEGIGSRALGRGSHAEGWFDPSFFATGPVAYFNGSHAEGEATLAGVNDAHAEGVGTAAAGFAAHSEAHETTAGADFSHAEGDRCVAGNPLRAFAIVAGGTAVTLPGGNFTSEFTNGQRVTFFPQVPYGPGTSAVVSSVPAFGGGNTTFNIATPIDSLTTAGVCVDTSVGQQSHAEGLTTRASAASSHAEGASTIASGVAAHAEGNAGTASGANSHVGGTGCTASAASSFAHGITCTANAAGAVACGNSTLASGVVSTALGDQTRATGRGSLSSGLTTVASGDNSTAVGNNVAASGQASLAAGQQGTASGVASFIQGYLCNATGDLSHAGGEGCTSGGRASLAHGLNNSAPGINTTAFGAGSLAAHEADQAFASGAFAALGDAQDVKNSFRGITPGVAPGEAVVLSYGTTTQTNYTLVNNKRYLITAKAISHKLAAGAAVPDYLAQIIAFVATVNNAGAVTFSAVTPVIAAIINGATFVAATLLPVSGAANKFTLVFTLAGGVTAQTITVVGILGIESLGS